MQTRIRALIAGILILFFIGQAFALNEKLDPDNAGDLAEWYLSSYSNVNDESDATYIQTKIEDTSSCIDLYNAESTSIPDGSSIISLTLWVRVKCTSATYKNTFYHKIKTHSTEYQGTSFADVGTSWTNKSYTWTSNPYTSTNWTISELNDLQIGIRSSTRKVLLAYYYGYCAKIWANVTWQESGVAPVERTFLISQTIDVSANVDHRKSMIQKDTETIMPSTILDQYKSMRFQDAETTGINGEHESHAIRLSFIGGYLNSSDPVDAWKAILMQNPEIFNASASPSLYRSALFTFTYIIVETINIVSNVILIAPVMARSKLLLVVACLVAFVITGASGWILWYQRKEKTHDITQNQI